MVFDDGTGAGDGEGVAGGPGIGPGAEAGAGAGTLASVGGEDIAFEAHPAADDMTSATVPSVNNMHFSSISSLVTPLSFMDRFSVCLPGLRFPDCAS